MRPADNINQLIRNLQLQASADLDKTVHDDITRAVAASDKTESPHLKPETWRIIMKSTVTKLAAAAGSILVLFLVLNNAESTLYAQIIESMKKARTIHAVGYAPKDGGMEKAAEIWYERDVAIKVVWAHNGNQRVILDNGQWRWEYSQGDDYAMQSKSLGINDLPREFTEPSRYLDESVRDIAGDMDVDGVFCESYVASYPDKPDSTRLMFWIDKKRRFRRFEEKTLENGKWNTVELCRVEYDIDIDHSVFEPSFGPDTRIVKPADRPDMLDTHFSLENAIFTKETMGLVFAVHKLQRCQDDLIFVVTSLRPSDQTLKDVESKDPHAMDYGDYQFGSCYERTDGGSTSYTPVRLGQIYHGGLMIKWTVFLPRGFEAGQVTVCKFELNYLYAEGKLAIKRKKAGLPDRERFKPIATLPLPDEQLSLENLISEAYEVVKLLDPTVAEARLILKSVPYTDKEMDDFVEKEEVASDGLAKGWKAGNKSMRLFHGQSKRPDQISKNSWAEDRLTTIQQMQRQ